MQSPIDINRKKIFEDLIDFPNIYYEEIDVKNVENNNWSIIFHCLGNNQLFFDSTFYNLVQFHFHSMAEHTFDGKRYPLEMHLVHKSEQEKILVFSILFDYGKESPTLEKLWSILPKTGKDQKFKFAIDLSEIIDIELGFFTYEGSLTTPPYTEGVRWIIQDKLNTVSKAQIERYRTIFPQNTYRPIQPSKTKSITFAPSLSEIEPGHLVTRLSETFMKGLKTRTPV